MAKIIEMGNWHRTKYNIRIMRFTMYIVYRLMYILHTIFPHFNSWKIRSSPALLSSSRMKEGREVHEIGRESRRWPFLPVKFYGGSVYRKSLVIGHICYTQSYNRCHNHRIYEAFMYLDGSTSTVDKTRHYIDSPSPLAMTAEEFHKASIQTAELAATYYAERPAKPTYTAPSREVLEHLRTSTLPEQGLA